MSAPASPTTPIAATPKCARHLGRSRTRRRTASRAPSRSARPSRRGRGAKRRRPDLRRRRARRLRLRLGARRQSARSPEPVGGARPAGWGARERRVGVAVGRPARRSRPAVHDLDAPYDPDDPPARRNPPRDWAAPPPWAAGAAGAARRGSRPLVGRRAGLPREPRVGEVPGWPGVPPTDSRPVRRSTIPGPLPRAVPSNAPASPADPELAGLVGGAAAVDRYARSRPCRRPDRPSDRP